MEIEVIRSRRKSMVIQVTRDLRVVVRAPLECRQKDIECFVRSREDWIRQSLYEMARRKEERDSIPLLSDAEIKKLRRSAEDYFPCRTEYFAELMHLPYGRITIRMQKTRWGSCSRQGNINYNALLMLSPSEVRDYVIVHELCHLKEMNHSAAFWQEVEQVLPDYRQRRRWLSDHGAELMARAGY